MKPLPHAEPAEIGLDPRRLDDAYRLLARWTDGPARAMSGAAILVGREGKMVAPRFFGRQGPEPDAEPIRADASFLLASITKPITYLAGLMLLERGLLNLNDPVRRYIPDFAAHHKEDIRVLHLYTHTSGMPDMLPNNLELRQRHAPLDVFIRAAVRDTVPLFAAGTNLRYQSMGTLVVAELVQRLSGMTIRDYLRREIFDPLGLRATALGSPGLERARLVRVDVPRQQEGKDYNWNSTYWQEFGAPWGGMFSSPEDLAVLCQLMLNGGSYEGVRLLSSATVERMTTNRLAELPELPEPIRRTQPWGLGWRMNHPGQPDSWSDLLGNHVFGHAGATGTIAWIDPQRHGFCIILTTKRDSPRMVSLSNVIASAFT